MRQLNWDTGLGVTSLLIHPSVKICHSSHKEQAKPGGQGGVLGVQGLVVQWLTKVKPKSRGFTAQSSPRGKFSTKIRVWSQAGQESVNSRRGSYARVTGRKMLRGPRPLEGVRMTGQARAFGGYGQMRTCLPSGAKILHWHVLLSSLLCSILAISILPQFLLLPFVCIPDTPYVCYVSPGVYTLGLTNTSHESRLIKGTHSMFIIHF